MSWRSAALGDFFFETLHIQPCFYGLWVSVLVSKGLKNGRYVNCSYMRRMIACQIKTINWQIVSRGDQPILEVVQYPLDSHISIFSMCLVPDKARWNQPVDFTHLIVTNRNPFKNRNRMYLHLEHSWIVVAANFHIAVGRCKIGISLSVITCYWLHVRPRVFNTEKSQLESINAMLTACTRLIRISRECNKKDLDPSGMEHVYQYWSLLTLLPEYMWISPWQVCI